MTPEEITAAERSIERAKDMVGDICAGRKRWTMSVPARPGEDADLVIMDGLDAGAKLLRALRDRPDQRAGEVRGM